MIVKILGILDIVVGILFWIFGIFYFESLGGLMFILGLFLLVKGLVFAAGGDVISVLDVIFGIVIIIGVTISMPKFVVIVISLFLLQKGIFSLLN